MEIADLNLTVFLSFRSPAWT